MGDTFTIVTRQSRLALWQAEHIKSELLRKHSDLNLSLLKVSTKGDKILDRSLAKIGGKGLFLKELQTALINQQADFAVHCLKDMPAETTAGLTIAALTQRIDPRDCLISCTDQALMDLPSGARIGTSSLRRATQLKKLRDDITIVDLRGNLDTRLAKLDSGEYDAIVLAAAGIVRLDLGHRVTQYFTVEEMVPAAGQGVLALECRENDASVASYLKPLNDPDTEILAAAERGLTAYLSASCQTPLGAHACFVGDAIELTGILICPTSHKQIKITQRAEKGQAKQLGQQLAQAILKKGGDLILAKINE